MRVDTKHIPMAARRECRPNRHRRKKLHVAILSLLDVRHSPPLVPSRRRVSNGCGCVASSPHGQPTRSQTTSLLFFVQSRGRSGQTAANSSSIGSIQIVHAHSGQFAAHPNIAPWQVIACWHWSQVATLVD